MQNLSIFPRWSASYVCVRGRYHETKDIPCQDAAAIQIKEEKLAICVCDGSGSASLSHLGAKGVAAGVTTWLLENSEKIFSGSAGIEKDIVKIALDCIHRQMEQHEGKFDDYACTLIAFLLQNDRVFVAHLGDGIIAIVEAGVPKILSMPDRGEFLNETFFITSSNAHSHIRTSISTISKLVTSFAITTDGPQPFLFHYKTKAVSAIVEQMASWLDEASPEEVSHGLEENIRNYFLPRTNDDCTIVVVRKKGYEFLFRCPVCSHSKLKRFRGGKTKFRLYCEACFQIIQIPEEHHNKYPRGVRKWIEYLHNIRNMKLLEMHKISKIPLRTLKRWLRTEDGSHHPEPGISC